MASWFKSCLVTKRDYLKKKVVKISMSNKIIYIVNEIFLKTWKRVKEISECPFQVHDGGKSLLPDPLGIVNSIGM